LELVRTVEGPDELDGGVPAMGTGLETREWRRGRSGWIGVTLASNPAREEGDRVG
jgi:hypothetical protein